MSANDLLSGAATGGGLRRRGYGLRDTLGTEQISYGKPPSALWSVAKHPKQWLRQVQGTESQYYRAIGSAEALMLKAVELKQHWMKGISGERDRQLLAQQQE